ncbi:MAG TPA: sensor histidine kinase [Anaerolineae bacterium]|nr:sensor histidine kinase [Anaerolineae bacterium]
MPILSEFSDLLSNLFHQVIHNPAKIPPVSMEAWPVGSVEQRLLVDFQLALKAIQTHYHQTEQAIEQAQTAAILEERQRLAQNLHNAINQSLFSAGLIAEVLPRLWERNPEDARQSLQDLRRLTRGAQAEMRGLLVELKPMILTDTTLADLLRQLGNALTGRINIPVTITVIGSEQQSFPTDVHIAFYRICQEAIQNIIKHAHANEVKIQLLVEEGTIELFIHDDGHGYDHDQASSGHYGLTMMQERAESIDALFTITSQPNEGTLIRISWTKDIQQEKQ